MRGGERDDKVAQKNFLFTFLAMAMFSGVYTCVTVYQIILFSYVQFAVYQLYLSEPLKININNVIIFNRTTVIKNKL